RFKSAAVRLENVASEWRQRLAGSKKSDPAADLLNTCFKRLSRLLVPLQSTVKGVYGHDPYGLTAQTTMIPALYDVQNLSRLAEGTEARWMQEVGLIRQRNRVMDGLYDATTLIEETIRAIE